MNWLFITFVGVDVNVYGYGPPWTLAQLHGAKDNTNIGIVIANVLDLDLWAETVLLAS